MIEIDGAQGGGGLVRTALTMAVLTGESFRIEAIRGARPTPGLRPQHLAAVRAVAQICDAEITGDVPNSETLTFRPGTLDGGSVAVDIGTAGSVMLLFDAVLPLAVGLDEPLSVTATGGTDVKWSPTAAYFRRVKLPLLRRFGLEAIVEIERTGFYPAGGGEATLWVEPSSLEPLALAERGAPRGVRIYSKASTDLESRSVAERQAAAAADELSGTGLDVIQKKTASADTDSTGSAITIRLDYKETSAGFDALGERGTPAEEVGRGAADAARAFDAGSAAVDEHMADQLLVALSLAGGRVSIPRRTAHVRTNRQLLSRFGFNISLQPQQDGTVLLTS